MNPKPIVSHRENDERRLLIFLTASHPVETTTPLPCPPHEAALADGQDKPIGLSITKRG